MNILHLKPLTDWHFTLKCGLKLAVIGQIAWKLYFYLGTWGRFSRWYTEHRGGPTIHCIRGIQRALHNELRVKMNELNLPNSASLIFHNWWPAPSPPAPAIATQLWTVKTRTSPDFAKPLAAGAGMVAKSIIFFVQPNLGWGIGALALTLFIQI